VLQCVAHAAVFSRAYAGRAADGVLQCVAVCCSVLQCVTVCCSVLHTQLSFLAHMQAELLTVRCSMV